MKFLKSAIIITLLTTAFTDKPARARRRISLVDINRAIRQKFVRLPSITAELAGNIVEYRAQHNFFNKLEDLLKVEGITEDIFEEIKPYLTMTPANEIETEEALERFEDIHEEDTGGGYYDIDIEEIQKYVTRPLDLNTANRSQFLEFPYITDELADEIIKYRRENRGFSNVDELREIMADDIVDELQSFFTVLEEDAVEEFHGDLRFRYYVGPMPIDDDYVDADEKFHHPEYFYTRYRMFYGNKAEFGIKSIHDDGGINYNYRNARDYFIRENYLLMRNVLSLDTLVLGNYKLDFGQGLHIQPNWFYIRPWIRRPRGIKDGGNKFYGIAGSKRVGSWEFFGFYSDNDIPVSSVNIDGSVDSTLFKIRSSFVAWDYKDANSDYFDGHTLNDRSYGTRVKHNLTASINIGCIYSEHLLDPVLDPGSSTEYLESGRGDKVRLIGLDAEYMYRNMRLLTEWGRTYYHSFTSTSDFTVDGRNREWDWGYGDGMQILSVFSYEKIRFLLKYVRLGEEYSAYYARPYIAHWWKIEEDTFSNFENREISVEYDGKNTETSLSFTNNIVLDTQESEYSVYISQLISPHKKIDIKAIYNPRWDGDSFENIWVGKRLEMIYAPVDHLRLKYRYQINSWTDKKDNTEENAVINFAELKYNPNSALTIYSRLTFWNNAPGTYHRISALETRWPNFLDSVPGMADPKYPGGYMRWYIMPTLKLSRNVKFWTKFEYWPVWQGDYVASSGSHKDQVLFRTQLDMSW